MARRNTIDPHVARVMETEAEAGRELFGAIASLMHSVQLRVTVPLFVETDPSIPFEAMPAGIDDEYFPNFPMTSRWPSIAWNDPVIGDIVQAAVMSMILGINAITAAEPSVTEWARTSAKALNTLRVAVVLGIEGVTPPDTDPDDEDAALELELLARDRRTAPDWTLNTSLRAVRARLRYIRAKGFAWYHTLVAKRAALADDSHGETEYVRLLQSIADDGVGVEGGPPPNTPMEVIRINTFIDEFRADVRKFIRGGDAEGAVEPFHMRLQRYLRMVTNEIRFTPSGNTRNALAASMRIGKFMILGGTAATIARLRVHENVIAASPSSSPSPSPPLPATYELQSMVVHAHDAMSIETVFAMALYLRGGGGGGDGDNNTNANVRRIFANAEIRLTHGCGYVNQLVSDAWQRRRVRRWLRERGGEIDGGDTLGWRNPTNRLIIDPVFMPHARMLGVHIDIDVTGPSGPRQPTRVGIGVTQHPKPEGGDGMLRVTLVFFMYHDDDGEGAVKKTGFAERIDRGMRVEVSFEFDERRSAAERPGGLRGKPRSTANLDFIWTVVNRLTNHKTHGGETSMFARSQPFSMDEIVGGGSSGTSSSSSLLESFLAPTEVEAAPSVGYDDGETLKPSDVMRAMDANARARMPSPRRKREPIAGNFSTIVYMANDGMNLAPGHRQPPTAALVAAIVANAVPIDVRVDAAPAPPPEIDDAWLRTVIDRARGGPDDDMLVAVLPKIPATFNMMSVEEGAADDASRASTQDHPQHDVSSSSSEIDHIMRGIAPLWAGGDGRDRLRGAVAAAVDNMQSGGDGGRRKDGELDDWSLLASLANTLDPLPSVMRVLRAAPGASSPARRRLEENAWNGDTSDPLSLYDVDEMRPTVHAVGEGGGGPAATTTRTTTVTMPLMNFMEVCPPVHINHSGMRGKDMPLARANVGLSGADPGDGIFMVKHRTTSQAEATRMQRLQFFALHEGVDVPGHTWATRLGHELYRPDITWEEKMHGGTTIASEVNHRHAARVAIMGGKSARITSLVTDKRDAVAMRIRADVVSSVKKTRAAYEMLRHIGGEGGEGGGAMINRTNLQLMRMTRTIRDHTTSAPDERYGGSPVVGTMLRLLDEGMVQLVRHVRVEQEAIDRVLGGLRVFAAAKTDDERARAALDIPAAIEPLHQINTTVHTLQFPPLVRLSRQAAAAADGTLRVHPLRTVGAVWAAEGGTGPWTPGPQERAVDGVAWRSVETRHDDLREAIDRRMTRSNNDWEEEEESHPSVYDEIEAHARARTHAYPWIRMQMHRWMDAMLMLVATPGPRQNGWRDAWHGFVATAHAGGWDAQTMYAHNPATSEMDAPDDIATSEEYAAVRGILDRIAQIAAFPLTSDVVRYAMLVHARVSVLRTSGTVPEGEPINLAGPYATGLHASDVERRAFTKWHEARGNNNGDDHDHNDAWWRGVWRHGSNTMAEPPDPEAIPPAPEREASWMRRIDRPGHVLAPAFTSNNIRVGASTVDTPSGFSALLKRHMTGEMLAAMDAFQEPGWERELDAVTELRHPLFRVEACVTDVGAAHVLAISSVAAADTPISVTSKVGGEGSSSGGPDLSSMLLPFHMESVADLLQRHHE